MRIATVGGGPGGLYFALLMKLRHPDYDVRVYERNPRDSVDGYGLVFWYDLLEQLRHNDEVSAAAVEAATYCWVNQVIELDGERVVDDESSGYGIHRQNLLRILSARVEELGVPIEYSREIASRAELGDVDLVVASDGANSLLRGSQADRFGTKVDLGRNKYVWLAADRVLEAFESDFVRTQAGWIWSAAYSIDDSTSTFVIECPPETWRGLRLDAMTASDSLRTLEHVFAGQLGNGCHLTGHLRGRETLLWRNFQRLTNERWHYGDVVLLGDAAHTTHFSIGSGARLALGDAISLANQLDRHTDRASAYSAYEAERRATLQRLQLEARSSARWYEEIGRYACLPATEFKALWMLRRSPLLPRVDPHLYYRLHEASSKVALLRRVRDLVGLRARDRRNSTATW